MFAPKEKIEEFENVLFYHFREAMGESILALNEEATNELFTFMFEEHYLEGDLTVLSRKIPEGKGRLRPSAFSPQPSTRF